MQILKSLSLRAGLSESQLLFYSTTASRRYKVYNISKRTGGTRTISQPSKDIKALQRIVCKSISTKFQIHESATAYKKGASIANNATRHKDTNFTLRLDFVNFFESFKHKDIVDFLLNVGEFSEVDASFMANLFCRKNALTIGAPASPYLTNIMMYDFDALIFDHCALNDCIYSRYADDIFVSTKKANILNSIHEFVINAVNRYNTVQLRINDKKTDFLSKKYHRSVTGIVITPDNEISLGRERKRKIKTEVYLALDGQLEDCKIEQLKGLLSFANDVEPDFIIRLKKKFGKDNLEKLTGNFTPLEN